MGISKVLVVNRGEIAVRIIRSLQELGIGAVAVYSEADKDCRHVQLADESYLIGPALATKSYLNAEKLVEVAKEAKVEAVHPGYGFLAENGAFAGMCEEAGLIFIGPTPENMKLAGDKLTARQTVGNANLPIIPGNIEGLLNLEEAQRVCADIGYPLMLKASAGGGGRGIRILPDDATLCEEFGMAAAEARSAFGDPTLYIEKLIQRPRHIEVQILGDGKGGAIHLNERNCSVQRRHQKLIEEAPSPGLSDDVRKAIHETAVQIAKVIKYRNAGTIEFLVDEDDNFYFMELNARIQVEHPVTEMITGVDLIKAQLSIASSGEIGIDQDAIPVWGHAIECRINAEDPDFEFVPCPGMVEEYRAPGGFGVRFDTHLYQGYDIPIFYDSLLGKLIVWGPTRKDALKTMERALKELTIEPVQTTAPFLREVLSEASFVSGGYKLDLVERMLESREDGGE